MLNLRITTGTAKNKRLKCPKIPDFRAVQEIAKSAIFSILGESVLGATCLDLFAGSGNMGIEALSRGASWCDFVDENPKSTQAIEKNLQNTGLVERADVYKDEAVKFVGNCPNFYDIVFVDPFYDDVKHKFLMEMLQEAISDKGIVVFLHGDKMNMENLIKKTDFKVVESRKYGKSCVDFLTQDSPSQTEDKTYT